MKGTDGIIKLVLWLCSDLRFLPGAAGRSAGRKIAQAAVRRERQSAASADYRDWEFLSAGYGMNDSPAPDSHDLFTNVFVHCWAYEEFLNSGKWPEQSMFVIDERDSQSKGSINKKGHFQTDLTGLAVEVKDSTRNPGRWAYYGFEANAKTAETMPKDICWSCHEQHAAVEQTFVQFYPTLKPVAKNFGTYNEARERVEEVN